MSSVSKDEDSPVGEPVRTRKSIEDQLSTLSEVDEDCDVVLEDYRRPLLNDLTMPAIRLFKLQLAVSEELRYELNASRDARIPSPRPTDLVARKLWSIILVEFQKQSPELDCFEESTFDHLGNWLVRTVIPQPNNRGFLRRIGSGFIRALDRLLSNSSSHGQRSVMCIPLPSSDWYENNDDGATRMQTEDLNARLIKAQKKWSLASSVSASSVKEADTENY